jgi:CheY-like chemotaxis protein
VVKILNRLTFSSNEKQLPFIHKKASMIHSRTYTVLYIEDSEANRQLVAFILESKEYLTLLCAPDGTRGIAMARNHLPDIILLDISLPDIDGYSVLASLKGDPTTAKIPVIALSGYAAPPTDNNSPMRFDRYLMKPITIAPLCEAIDELLP